LIRAAEGVYDKEEEQMTQLARPATPDNKRFARCFRCAEIGGTRSTDSMGVLLSLMAGCLVLFLSGCSGPARQKKELDRTNVAGVRARSADAFADLEAAEQGEPIPRPRSRDVDEADLAPEPKPKAEMERKPVDSVPINPARKAPAWTRSQPRMPGYYVGIGISTSHGDEARDWDRARNHAYVELASTLKVHIHSAITDYFKENNLKLYDKDNLTKDVTRQDSSYAKDTQFFVSQTLEGVEIHDRWKDVAQEKYWMLVRLSQAEIARRIRERLEKARKKALDHVRAAVAAESQGRIGAAFSGYFKSYLALREYFGGVIEYDMDNDGKKDVLNHQIERAVRRLASGLDWQVEKDELTAVNGSGLLEPLRVLVTYAQQPVKSFPVNFSFQRGKGSVESQVSTDSSGLAQARLVKVFGRKKAILTARVDVASLVDSAQDSRIVQAKFNSSLGAKTGKFYVSLEELSAHIHIVEELLGEEVKPGSVAVDVKDRLHAELGLVFTKTKRNADLVIEGKASVGSCTDFFAQRQCTARVTVTVSDERKNRQLFSNKYKVRGNAGNDKEAGRVALSKVGKRLAKKIIQSIK
jgi:hypothetical protein